MQIRRVVTSSSTGKACFVSDQYVAAVSPPLIGNEIARIWGFDDSVRLPVETEPQPLEAQFFPPPGGLRLVVWTLPPDGTVEPPVGEARRAAKAEMDRVAPGMADVAHTAAGMHGTASVDCQYVVSGEPTLVLDGGDSRTLHPGDIVIVNGCAHAWHNHGDRNCVLLGALIGAHPTTP
jgi:hypothetical protein